MALPRIPDCDCRGVLAALIPDCDCRSVLAALLAVVGTAAVDLRSPLIPRASLSALVVRSSLNPYLASGPNFRRNLSSHDRCACPHAFLGPVLVLVLVVVLVLVLVIVVMLAPALS